MTLKPSPEKIESLKPGEMFVFGVNSLGIHAAGAARIAVNKFGAIMGQGQGLQGNAYAIDTMSGKENLRKEIETFLEFARTHPELTFLMTPIGTGIAGY